MKENNRPIVFFKGEVSPKKLVEVLGPNFSGDIVINGDFADVYSGEDTTTIISTNGGSMYIIGGGIYFYNGVSIEADVFVDKTINVDEPLNIFGSLYIPSKDSAIEGFNVYITENLYIDYTAALDVGNLVVGGDLCMSVNPETIPADVGGKIRIE